MHGLFPNFGGRTPKALPMILKDIKMPPKFSKSQIMLITEILPCDLPLGAHVILISCICKTFEAFYVFFAARMCVDVGLIIQKVLEINAGKMSQSFVSGVTCISGIAPTV